jgi:integrase
MAATRRPTKYPGVYERKSETRIHERKSDVCFDITYKVDGKKIWEKCGWVSEGYSAKLASTIRADRVRDIRHGEDLPKQKQKAPLFSDVAKKYLSWASTNKMQEGIHDKSRYENHIEKRYAQKRLNEITPFDLEKMKVELTKKGLAPQSVKHCLILVRMMINKAIAWGMWQGENPVKKVKLPIVQNERQRFLSYEEAKLLLDKLKETSTLVHDMALLSLHCGLRLGEITNLKGMDIEFENGTIHIADPKNKTARKAFMTEAIKEMFKGRLTENPEEYIFTDRRNKGRITSVSHTYPKVVKELGFNKGITDRRQLVTFHTLRHTHASWLAISGESLLVIQQSLGHKDLQMLRRYAHLSSDSRRQAAMRLEEGFAKGKEQKHIDLQQKEK